jgi:hypothetical protein
MGFFVDEILENDEVRAILKKTPENEQAREIASRIINGERIILERGILPIYVLNYLADHALEKNHEKGISREITVNTLKDVNVWLDNYKAQYGETGLGEFSWLIYHYTGDLFKLGRLQYRLEKSLEGVPEGKYAIETHIPQGEPLTEEACLESFKTATEFFNKVFPETKVHYFMCDSWLLNPNLEKILKAESNIVRFMKLWTPIPFVSDNSAQAIERVFGFGFKKENIKNAPEETSLQRALKNYIISGGSMDLTAGYRKI